jgi:hypothetical protein
MRWVRTTSVDRDARAIADRHYNRQKPGSIRFVPPGRCVVFITQCRRAVWVTSWPYAEYVLHDWGGAWINTLFRNEGAGLSSELILEAIAATRASWIWDPPSLGMVTFVDPRKIREKKDPGYCYMKAGFSKIGQLKDGKLVFQLLPGDMPESNPPWMR